MTPAEKAFITAKIEIDIELARLIEMSEDHFDTEPECINWADVAEINRILSALKNIG